MVTPAPGPSPLTSAPAPELEAWWWRDQGSGHSGHELLCPCHQAGTRSSSRRCGQTPGAPRSPDRGTGIKARLTLKVCRPLYCPATRPHAGAAKGAGSDEACGSTRVLIAVLFGSLCVLGASGSISFCILHFLSMKGWLCMFWLAALQHIHVSVIQISAHKCHLNYLFCRSKTGNNYSKHKETCEYLFFFF